MIAGPADYPRRILLLATGLSPQVVMQGLYALAVQPRPPSCRHFAAARQL
jgi:hypothetical protein